jgi:hypothetical protein
MIYANLDEIYEKVDWPEWMIVIYDELKSMDNNGV